ncbi:MAG: LPS assembly lipoprotein LptE [Candidatus Goldbacteria bacterium]|nr:LPS assembly lipoprotein LptE [Candidatus Goldiibacteriota bacterium]
MKTFLKIIFTFSLYLTLFSCATYSPQVALPSDIKSIAIPVFVNKTDRYNIEQYITQKTIDAFLADGRVAIKDEKNADAILKCRISKYIHTPIRFNANQIAQEYRLRIYLEIYFFNNIKQHLLWKDETSIWEETTYFVANDLGMPVEDEVIARNRVMDKLAERILRRVIHGW